MQLRLAPLYQRLAATVVLSAAVLASSSHARSDAQTPRTVNVLQHGATINDASDDTAFIQKTIDSAQVGDIVLFPRGVYYVTRVGIKAGITYRGQGATIRRPILPDVLPDGTAKKWVRTFDASMPGYLYSGDEDSPLSTIEGFTFYGDRDAQGAYQKYEQEHAHFIMLMSDPARKGRLRTRVQNCRFRENVADGLSIYVNCDVQVLNNSSYNCFRGGCVLTGGHTKVSVDGFTSDGTHYSTGVDIEVDGDGFGKTKFVDLTLRRLRLWDGTFDVGVSDGSKVLVEDAYVRSPFTLSAHEGSEVVIENSRLGMSRLNEQRSRFVFPGKTTIRNSSIVLEPPLVPEGGLLYQGQPDKWAAIHLYWNISGTHYKNQYLRFENCDFAISGRVPEEDETHVLIVKEFAPEDAQNTLEFINCTASHDFDFGLPQ